MAIDDDMLAYMIGLNPTPGPTNVGAPMNVLPQSAGGAMNAAQPGGTSTNAFLNTLKSIPALQPPQAQKVSTPAAPKIEPVKGGNLMALLQALNVPGQTAASAYKLPATLEPPTLGFR